MRAPPETQLDARAQLADLIARADVTGHRVAEPPDLRLRRCRARSSRTVFSRRRPLGRRRLLHPPRIELSRLAVRLPPAERARVLAHDLAHVIRRQSGADDATTALTRLERTIGALGTLVALAALLAVPALSFPPGRAPPAVVAVVVAATAVGWNCYGAAASAGLRREETATDALASTLLGRPISAADVAHLRRVERPLGPLTPGWLRTHPRPAARAAATQAVADALAPR